MSQNEAAQAVELIHKVGGSANAQPLVFRKTGEFHAFEVEVTEDDGDFVFHFYLPEHLRTLPVVGPLAAYWNDTFGACLSDTACSYFASEYPRLKATHVEEYEINSWWFRAGGFVGQVLDKEGFIQGFYKRLDEALNSKSM